MKRFLFSLLLLLPLCGGAPLFADVVYRDSFGTYQQNTDIIGCAPPPVPGSGLNGRQYLRRGGGSWLARIVEPGALTLGADRGAALPLAAAPGYTVPASLTLTLTFNLGTLDTSGAFAGRGVGLGFWSGPNDGFVNSFNTFTGLVVSKQGAIKLMVNGESQPRARFLVGDLDPLADHTLRYTIDTLGGRLTALTLDGRSCLYAFAGAAVPEFTAERLAYAGFLANSATGGDAGARIHHFMTESSGVVYRDSFGTHQPGTSIIGRKPPPVPGSGLNDGQYLRRGAGSWLSQVTQPGVLTLGADRGVALPLAETLGSAIPASLTLTLTFNLGTLDTSGAFAGRGVGLGFWSGPNDGFVNSFNTFTGIVVKEGSIKLMVNGGSQARAQFSVGDLDPQADHTLRYTIDTRRGRLAALTLDGVSRLDAFSGVAAPELTAERLAYVGFLANSATGEDRSARIHNFMMESSGVVCLDSFRQYPENTDIIGQAPPASDPGLTSGQYLKRGGSTWLARVVEPGALTLGADRGAALPLAAASGYAVPASLPLMLTFNLGTLDTDDKHVARGVGLGFWSEANGNFVNSYNAFTGIVVGKQGAISLLVNGEPKALAWFRVGDLNPLADHTLRYTIDTRRGRLTSLTLDGRSYLHAFAEVGVPELTAEELSYVGFLAYSTPPGGAASASIRSFMTESGAGE